MALVDKTIYYYLILFSTFLLNFSLIPLVFEVLSQKITSNIPYLTLICFIISYLIMLFIVISRKYYIHIFFYLIGLTCISILIFSKRKYDKTNVKIVQNKKNQS